MASVHRKSSVRRFAAIASVLGLSTACSADIDGSAVESTDEPGLGSSADSGVPAESVAVASTQLNASTLSSVVPVLTATKLPTVTLTPTLTTTTPTTSSTRYFVLDIGAVGASTQSIHINQAGAVAWNAGSHALLFRDCSSRDLGSLAGGTTQANALNNSDVVVGKSFKNGKFHAFSWSNGVMRDLGGNFNEEATTLNFWNDVAGVESVDGTLAATGVRYADGVAAPMARFLLNPPSGFANAPRVVAMNDSRVVVGSTGPKGSTIAAISFNFGALWQRLAGVPGMESSTEPAAINYLGHVAGTAGQGLPHAFISRDPALPATDLGTLPGGSLSVASGINRYDRVVGLADRNATVTAMFHDGTTMVDLNTRLWNPTGWVLKLAADINDKGQIVGFGSFNGSMHAVLLLPMPQAPLVPPCRPDVATAG
jgi:probable HAF family extracellular repeat protein